MFKIQKINKEDDVSSKPQLLSGDEKETETLAETAPKKKKKQVTVLKGTAEIVDPTEYQSHEIETITENARKKRISNNKQVIVLKKTAIIVDPTEYQSHEIETITEAARKTREKREKKVIVLKKTAIIVDPTKYQNHEIETITEEARKTREKQVIVLKKTAIIVDPTKYQNHEIETITEEARKKREKQLIVLEGTAIIFDPIQHQGKKIETITEAARRKRISSNKLVTVLKKTAIIVDPTKYQSHEIETITEQARKIREKKVIVLEGKAEIFDATKHQNQKTETITESARQQREKRMLKKAAKILTKDNSTQNNMLNTEAADSNDSNSNAQTIDGDAELADASEKQPLNDNHSQLLSIDQAGNVHLSQPFTNDNSQNSNDDTRPTPSSNNNNSIVPLSLFSNDGSNQNHAFIKIKKEKEPNQSAVTVDIEAIMQLLSKTIKLKREGNNAQGNCGHLTHYVIEALYNAINNQPMPERDIPTEDSGLDSTDKSVDYHRVEVKEERVTRKKRGKNRFTIWPSTSIAHRTNHGLHSALPNRIAPMLDLEQSAAESTFIEIEPSEVNQLRIKLDDMTTKLMEHAKNCEGIVIGQIDLYRPGRDGTSHVLAFCATEEKVFYIDGQLYNGLTHTGEMIFDHLSEAHQFIRPYTNQQQGEFIEDCFYLIHHKIPAVIQSPQNALFQK